MGFNPIKGNEKNIRKVISESLLKQGTFTVVYKIR